MDEMLLNRHNDVFLKSFPWTLQETAEALQILLSFFRDVASVEMRHFKNRINSSGTRLKAIGKICQRGTLRI